MTISLIVAHGKNREIGKGNKLLWNIPCDMTWFRHHTSKQKVIMGRKTYASIGRPLPNRENIVLSKSGTDIPGVMIMDDINQAIEYGKEKEVFVIGGEQIYKEFLPHADFLYITEVHGEFEADSFFPEYEHLLDNYQIIYKNLLEEDELNRYDTTFLIYKKLS